MKRLLIVVALMCGCGQVDGEPPPPPVDADQLYTWLREGHYEHWRSESAKLPGLNDTRRRVFVNDLVHPNGSPVGAAAVREIWDRDGDEQLGWSALIKTENGWWFYETFDVQHGGTAFAGFDAPGCTGCHHQAPDVIQSTLPLQ